jgi:hypothetical protein
MYLSPICYLGIKITRRSYNNGKPRERRKKKSRIKIVFGVLINFIIFPWLLFGGVPICLSILAKKPIWRIINAFIIITTFYGYFYMGTVIGIVYSLENPAKINETQRKLTIGDLEIWKSKAITFRPSGVRKLLVRGRHKHI